MVILSIFLLLPYRSNADQICYECKTLKQTIVVSKTANGLNEYKSWDMPKPKTEKPDIDILQKDAAHLEGTGVCSTTFYNFKKDDAEYSVQDNLNCAPGHPPKNVKGRLVIRINGKIKEHFWCIN
jgi:hypothetical protein